MAHLRNHPNPAPTRARRGSSILESEFENLVCGFAFARVRFVDLSSQPAKVLMCCHLFPNGHLFLSAMCEREECPPKKNLNLTRHGDCVLLLTLLVKTSQPNIPRRNLLNSKMRRFGTLEHLSFRCCMFAVLRSRGNEQKKQCGDILCISPHRRMKFTISHYFFRNSVESP